MTEKKYNPVSKAMAEAQAEIAMEKMDEATDRYEIELLYNDPEKGPCIKNYSGITAFNFDGDSFAVIATVNRTELLNKTHIVKATVVKQ